MISSDYPITGVVSALFSFWFLPLIFMYALLDGLTNLLLLPTALLIFWVILVIRLNTAYRLSKLQGRVVEIYEEGSDEY